MSDIKILNLRSKLNEARKEIKRLTAENNSLKVGDNIDLVRENALLSEQCESLQNKWSNRELSQQDSDALMAENKRLRAALEEMYSAENYEQLTEMLDEALERKDSD